MPHFDPVPRLPARGGKGRRLAFVAGFALSAGLRLRRPRRRPGLAQGISLLRDTETEDMLKSYEAPLAKAAGLEPGAVHMYLVGDPEVNAFAAEGQNIFIMSGIILDCKTPNELIGVMAHETGHIAAGHISRTGVGMEHAMIPMLLSMVLGRGRHGAGRRRCRHGDHGRGRGDGAGADGRLHPGAGIHRRPDRAQASGRHASIADGPLPDLRALRHRTGPERLQDRQICRGPSHRSGASGRYRNRCERLALARREGPAASHPHLRNGAGQARRLYFAGGSRRWIAIRKATPANLRAMPAPWPICASPNCKRRFPPPTA